MTDDELNEQLQVLHARISALTARVVALENPPEPEPPTEDTPEA